MTENKHPTFTAVILDMDGVVTKTATLHAQAWKEMFDEFMENRQGKDFQPLVIDRDYKQYIDGIPRFEGVRRFLKSRNIAISDGQIDDSPTEETVYGLGNRKNELFRSILEKKGVHVYEDTLEMLKKWKKAKLKLAIISSSRNCRHIIESAGLTELFDARVDGETLEKENLNGKPDPDIFLKASEVLGVDAKNAIIIEDAIAGVEAGKKGRFGLVVGVARHGESKELKDAGADIVVEKLTELRV
ncbi:alpha,alpha-trehalase [Algoriphagus sp. 4150]|uniref:beta-phosphoglucomutase family hydrolase n=1 Tax=Algoriphagus sp. 4150 TaxID=2817756 RepID=UPI0028577BB4|nr:beta-phosphoglucomutase family hydrolase [Algoriphagus sp. 4150]MDR7127857.1 alpha,alpha-trehalase [Algoriphagus sp. 4150]